MTPSQACYDLIESSEGLRLTAYRDSCGIPTIGYGHTEGVTLSMTCTEEQAYAWLLADVASAANIVNNAVTAPISQNEFDALVSFTFNVGPGKAGVRSGFCTLKNGNPSTMLTAVNDQKTALAAHQFDLWTRGNGVVLPGLVARRAKEKAMFLGESA